MRLVKETIWRQNKLGQEMARSTGLKLFLLFLDTHIDLWGPSVSASFHINLKTFHFCPSGETHPPASLLSCNIVRFFLIYLLWKYGDCINFCGTAKWPRHASVCTHTHTHTHTHIHTHSFSHVILRRKWLDIFPCANQQISLLIHSKCNSLHLLTPDSQSIPLLLPPSWQPHCWEAEFKKFHFKVFSFLFLLLNGCHF